MCEKNKNANCHSFKDHQIDIDKEGKNQPIRLAELFGADVYNFEAMQKTLPKPILANFSQIMNGSRKLDKNTADAIAHAVKIWAMDKGATHFTHWFQPQTGATAEKHDSFLNIKYEVNDGLIRTIPLDSFSGNQLLQAEPDASSFPNGGSRSTFEARGYTVWDINSPMFVQEAPHETAILYIPSAFISYHGDALDEKTLLLRSCDAVSSAATELLEALSLKPEKIQVSLGIEQEFFLVDRSSYLKRPDIRSCGRSLFGLPPPKHQQLEDHYFGHIPSKVMAAMSEAELILWRLGVPMKTRHNEVAPAQFEMAPIYEEANIAVDHNLLTMDVIQKAAHHHGLKALFHEKPFEGVNGSGKHCNWSLSTLNGDNLLDPSSKPEENVRFIAFLISILIGIREHGGLLNSAIATSGNQHRLGANEAPPSIISVFLGEQLDEVLNSLDENRPVRTRNPATFKSISLGESNIDLKVAHLPEIARDRTDRNRTSPFAFTGNKFEFRAVGSKQSPSLPVAMINAITSAGLRQVANALNAKGAKGNQGKIISILQSLLPQTRDIRFEGDNYCIKWHEEALKRGLPIFPGISDAFGEIINSKHKDLLVNQLKIVSESELKLRHHVMCEKYSKDIIIESKTMRNIVIQNIIPASFTYRKELASGLEIFKAVGIQQDSLNEREILLKLNEYSQGLLKNTKELEELIDLAENTAKKHDWLQSSIICDKQLRKALQSSRYHIDLIESIISASNYPFPKYGELFY